MEADPARDLLNRIERHLRDWSVQLEHTAETETSVLLYGNRRGQPVLLKVLRNEGDEWHSGEVLAAFSGRGVVRVCEQTGGAVLLERLRPGTPLVQLTLAGQDEDATDILADVIRAMAPGPAGGSALAVDWAAGFERHAGSGDSRIPTELLGEAHGLYLQLCSSQTRVRLLHGDLHHYNVLLDAQRGWLAIDPKGVVGEPEFEIGAWLRNPYDRPDLFAQAAVAERRLKQLTDKLDLDYLRALSWAFAQAVLSAVWTVEDGFPVGPQHAGLLLARAIRPMLGGLS